MEMDKMTTERKGIIIMLKNMGNSHQKAHKEEVINVNITMIEEPSREMKGVIGINLDITDQMIEEIVLITGTTESIEIAQEEEMAMTVVTDMEETIEEEEERHIIQEEIHKILGDQALLTTRVETEETKEKETEEVLITVPLCITRVEEMTKETIDQDLEVNNDC